MSTVINKHIASFFMPYKLFGLVLVCGILLAIQPVTHAADDITAMEQSFFSRDYAFDTPDNRLARLEKFVMGNSQNGAYNDRLARLMSVAIQNKVNTGSIPLDPDEDLVVDPELAASFSAHPAERPFQPTNQSSGQQASQNEVAMQDVTDYPMVTDMERKLYHQGFEHEAIANRLARLEQSVFQATAPPEAPLQYRVDKLLAKILPNDPLVTQKRMESQYAASSVLRNFPQHSSQMASGDLAIYGALNGIEMQLLGKSFTGEPLVQRISRLETRVFGRIQAGTIDARFDQIASNYQTALQRNWTPQPQAPGLPPNFQVPAQPRPPLHVGTGNMLQDLARLETRVFGQSFDQIPVPNRLANLEIQMMNQTFVFMRPDQRMVQLLLRADFVGTNRMGASR